MAARQGVTALVLPVPEADPLVSHWRDRLDPSAALGMPAHVTVLAPFLPLAAIGTEEQRTLAEIFDAGESVEVEFAGFGSFPGVLYLRPDPEAPIGELTAAVVARWPQAPPYEGLFDAVVPHLTVSVDAAAEVAEEARRAIAPKLPIRTTLTEVRLAALIGGRWRWQCVFPLGASPARYFQGRP